MTKLMVMKITFIFHRQIFLLLKLDLKFKKFVEEIENRRDRK